MKLTPKQEKYYVYHLIDPRCKSVFYVGKGTGGRLHQHERDAAKLKFANSEKEQRIHDIWSEAKIVRKEVVAWFKSEAEAYSFEKMEIDRIGIENLTNISNGSDPQALKALRRGEAFIHKVELAIPNLCEKSKAAALVLIKEMQENIVYCKKELGGLYGGS